MFLSLSFRTTNKFSL